MSNTFSFFHSQMLNEKNSFMVQKHFSNNFSIESILLNSKSTSAGVSDPLPDYGEGYDNSPKILDLDANDERSKKRPRTAFSASQIKTLESEFERSKYLSVAKRGSLARQLHLSETQIKIWFQNRRTKWKRKYTSDVESYASRYYQQLGIGNLTRPMVVGDRLWLFCSSNNNMASVPSPFISATNSTIPATANSLSADSFATWNPYVKNISTTPVLAFPYPCISSEYDQHSLALSSVSIDPYSSILHQMCPTPFQYLPMIDQNSRQHVSFDDPLIIVAPETEEYSSPSNGLAELERVFGDSNINFLDCLNKDNKFTENPFVSEDDHTEDYESKNSDIDCEQIDND